METITKDNWHEAYPDLYGADLRDADLRGADLHDADLHAECWNIYFGPLPSEED